jgi:hypothetical protein
MLLSVAKASWLHGKRVGHQQHGREYDKESAHREQFTPHADNRSKLTNRRIMHWSTQHEPFPHNA